MSKSFSLVFAACMVGVATVGIGVSNVIYHTFDYSVALGISLMVLGFCMYGWGLWKILNCIHPPYPFDQLKDEEKMTDSALNEAINVIEELLLMTYDHVSIPESNCRCHISPPCNDCVEYSHAREAIENGKSLLKKYRGGK